MGALTVPLLFKPLFQLRKLLLVLFYILRHKMSFAFPFKASLILKQSLLSLSHRKKLPDILGVYILRHLFGVSGCLIFDG